MPDGVANTQPRDTRSLAAALGRQWTDGIGAARSGAVAVWTERALGDAQLAARLRDAIDEVSGSADPTQLDTLLCRTIALIDPRAPMFWRGTALMPAALGPLLAEAMLAPGEHTLSPAAIEESMKKWATDKGTPGRDDQYGVGLISPRATLRGLGLAR